MQGPDKRIRLQRIQVRLNGDPPQQPADESRKRRQYIVHSPEDLLLRKRKLDAFIDFTGVEKLNVRKTHQRRFRRVLGSAMKNRLPQLCLKGASNSPGAGIELLYGQFARRTHVMSGAAGSRPDGRGGQPLQHITNQCVCLSEDNFHAVGQ